MQGPDIDGVFNRNRDELFTKIEEHKAATKVDQYSDIDPEHGTSVQPVVAHIIEHPKEKPSGKTN